MKVCHQTRLLLSALYALPFLAFEEHPLLSKIEHKLLIKLEAEYMSQVDERVHELIGQLANLE